MTTLHNARLPFDVLVPTFEYYVDEETMNCFSGDAITCLSSMVEFGTGASYIMGDINIVFKREGGLSRVSRRIERSGAGSPFYIRITGDDSRRYPDYTQNSLYECLNTPRPVVCCEHQAARFVRNTPALIEWGIGRALYALEDIRFGTGIIHWYRP